MSTFTWHCEKDGSYIQIDAYALLTSIPAHQLVKLVEQMACMDEVIRHVTDQIIECWTESGFKGTSSVAQADSITSNALDHAWRMVAKASSDVARREIERLEAALANRHMMMDRICAENQRLLQMLDDKEKTISAIYEGYKKVREQVR